MKRVMEMAEHLLVENSHIFDLIKNNLPLFIVDRQCRITYVNEAFCQLTKYKEKDLINESIHKLHMEKINCAEDSTIKDCFFESSPNIKIEIKYRDGMSQETYAMVAGTYLLNENNEISHYVILFLNQVYRLSDQELPIHPLQYLQTLEKAVNESNAVIVTDRKGKVLAINKAYTALSQYKPEEIIGKTPALVKSGYQAAAFYEDMWNTILAGDIWHGELRNRRKDGSIYWVHSTTVPIVNQAGEPTMFIAVQTDITRRMEAERSLQKTLQHNFEKTVGNLYNVVFKYKLIKDEIVFTLLEGKMLEKLKLSLDQLTMDNIRKGYSADEVKRIDYHFQLALSGQQTYFDIDFQKYSLLIYLSPIFEDEEVKEVVGTIIDITHRKKAESLAKQRAYYDFLTKLPNRRYIQKKLEQLISEHQIKGASFAVLFIDIDRFKVINDSMGHSAGDDLLIQFAQRLLSTVRTSDFVARFGGDEFIVLLPEVTREETERLAQKIAYDLSLPFFYRKRKVTVRASIGISLYPKDGIDADAMIGNADIAMYENKNKKNHDYQLFTEDLRQNLLEQTLLEIDLQKAIEGEQFTLDYQAKYDLSTRKITGFEALLRWKHPEKGKISPDQFISIAEDTGLILPIGQWVLEEASKQLKDWHEAGFEDLTMAINISIAQFNHPKFIDFVKKALKKSNLQAQFLNLEVTESMMLEKERAEQKLKELRNLGVAISIDDFGTGYSSLSYLSHYPITHLKIDRSFIHQFTKPNQAIVKTIITLAKALDLKVVAEGVETEEHEQFLKALACDEVQGYLYARPMAANQIKSFLVSNY